LKNPQDDLPELKFLRRQTEKNQYNIDCQARQIAAIKSGVIQAPPEGLTVDSPQLLQDVPPPERQWCVRGWIPDEEVTGLYGDGGLGKSLAAQQLATCVALGVPWFGLPTDKRRVLYVSCEETTSELHRRQAAINRSIGCTFSDLGHCEWICRVGEDNALVHLSCAYGAHSLQIVTTPFHDQIRYYSEAHSVSLLIVDTAAKVYPLDENNRYQVDYFVSRILGNIARELCGAVVLVAHPSRAGIRDGDISSGSTGWNNAFRSRMTFTRPKNEGNDPDVRILSRKKANYASIDGEVQLRYDDGAWKAETNFGGALGTAEARGIENRVLDCLSDLVKRGHRLSPSNASTNCAAKMIKRQGSFHDASKAKIDTALVSLEQQNRIEIRTEGPASRTVRYYAPSSNKVMLL